MLSEKYEMSSELVVWASQILRDVIAPPGSAESKGGRILVAALTLKWSESRTKAVWYADERVSLKPRELRDIEEKSGVAYGRQELRDVEELIAAADRLLAQPDTDFYRPFVAALRAFVGALDRPGAEVRTEEG